MDAKAEARAELLRERAAGLWNDDEGFEVGSVPADAQQDEGVTTEDDDR